MKNARQMPQTNLRLPRELKDYLRRKADENLRSLTAEIAARLEESRKREEQAHAQQ